MLRKVMFLIGALMIPAGAAMAQPGPGVGNGYGYGNGYGGNGFGNVPHAPEIIQDRHELRDDIRDARRLRDLAWRWDQARWAHRYGELYQLENELRVLVRQELRESRRELRADFRYDDWRDQRSERMEVRRRFQIARELDFLYGRMDWQAMNRKRALMGELIALARQELRGDFREVRETPYRPYDRWR